ncbi:S24 family peptidase [Paenibacillus kribbensis]|uniref:LexA family protein n=1 Tax=Paenibacillus kribbensis TaxID=172713 RepID=UPI002DB86A64|nr:S24 family peptidase [Paenibacillus kribbensis]MEC0233542.1 S24 family peptidase [Paenibacillus kribbensis]
MTKNNDSKLFYIAVGGNINKYRTIRNYSLQILADKVGLTKKTIQRYENGEIKIAMNRIEDIAEALNVEVPALLEGTETFLGSDINDLANAILPIVGSVSCGKGVLAFENIEGYEPAPKEWISGSEHFYLRAKGDSMTGARIFDGDLLLIRKQETVENGEIAVVLYGEEAVLKRVYINGPQIVLQSENPAYETVFKTVEEVKIVGKLKKIIINM